MGRYLVVESTPGYMPEVLEPPVFDSKRAAMRHARDLVQELKELGHAHVKRSGLTWRCEQSHRDLGRIVEVVEIPWDRELEMERV